VVTQRFPERGVGAQLRILQRKLACGTGTVSEDVLNFLGYFVTSKFLYDAVAVADAVIIISVAYFPNADAAKSIQFPKKLNFLCMSRTYWYKCAIG
jgi:hypothetical protein